VANVLFLTHRIPYPPDKGDKVRSYHLFRHLAKRHRVFLGTFVDDAADAVHVDRLEGMCAGAAAFRLDPLLARWRSASGLWRGEALTLPFYRQAAMQRWVAQTISQESIDVAIVFSSAMAQYVSDMSPDRVLVDFVDVDSAKWTQYASERRWPLSWLYRREGRRLLEFERSVARRVRHSFFATEQEAELFRNFAPECGERVSGMCNGVDAEFFSPQHQLASPFAVGELPLVFTGAMDYWPNVDAVVWFARQVLPELRRNWPGIRFYVVGRNPTRTVLALQSDSVTVTGTVADVRPYLRHAAVVVAPLRVARGIQNKVLEAMAMARPVVASAACAAAIDARIGQELDAAEDASGFVDRVDTLLRQPQAAESLALAARARVMERYSWQAHLSRVDKYLDLADRTERRLARPRWLP
jgi:sugar transferase (PEP-CTERM/EpsH1 system associated)